MDSFPFYIDGKKLGFHRKIDDTNKDGRLDGDDNGAIWAFNFDRQQDVQITMDANNPIHGVVHSNRLFLSIEKAGARQISSLPLEGQIRWSLLKNPFAKSFTYREIDFLFDGLVHRETLSSKEAILWHLIRGNYGRADRLIALSETQFSLERQVLKAIQNRQSNLADIDLQSRRKLQKLCQTLDSSDPTLCAYNESQILVAKKKVNLQISKSLDKEMANISAPPLKLELKKLQLRLRAKVLGVEEAWLALEAFCKANLPKYNEIPFQTLSESASAFRIEPNQQSISGCGPFRFHYDFNKRLL